MFKMYLVAAFLTACAGSATAQSGTFNDHYIGCLTEQDLDQLYSAINSDDKRLRDSLMGKVCVPIKGYEFSILDRGILTTTVRVYVGDSSVDLIVPSEAVR